MKTLTWQKPGQQNVAQELIKIIINYVAELRFNTSPEHWKCAQVVLYEALQKPEGAALITYPLQDKTDLVLSVIDYRLQTKETTAFWNSMFHVMGIATDGGGFKSHGVKEKKHDLLMDGPVD